jgi:CheY-like chemotaxis protein
VFEMFSQVESALSRSRGGLGIGLALTQRLLQMHGGGVKAYSDGLGKGSRFHVQLPLVQRGIAPVRAPAAATAQPLAQAGLSILVADDNVDAAETLATLFEVMGHRVTRVNDGEAAVASAGQGAFDLVVLDIGMPKLNGYDACRRIRAQARDPQPMLVALTGWGQEQDLTKSREAGFDRHLVKPVEAQALEALLAQIRNPGAQGQGALRDSG